MEIDSDRVQVETVGPSAQRADLQRGRTLTTRLFSNNLNVQLKGTQ
jgi:hypothetical protein